MKINLNLKIILIFSTIGIYLLFVALCWIIINYVLNTDDGTTYIGNSEFAIYVAHHFVNIAYSCFLIMYCIVSYCVLCMYLICYLCSIVLTKVTRIKVIKNITRTKTQIYGMQCRNTHGNICTLDGQTSRQLFLHQYSSPTNLA